MLKLKGLSLNISEYLNAGSGVCWEGGRNSADLLPVVGGVREHGGHVEHQLVVLIGGVQRVHSRGVGCNTRQGRERVRPHDEWPLFQICQCDQTYIYKAEMR